MPGRWSSPSPWRGRIGSPTRRCGPTDSVDRIASMMKTRPAIGYRVAQGIGHLARRRERPAPTAAPNGDRAAVSLVGPGDAAAHERGEQADERRETNEA